MRKSIFLLLFAAIAVISCNKDIINIENPSEDRVPLRIRIKNILTVETKGIKHNADYLGADIKAVLIDEQGEVHTKFQIRNSKPYLQTIYLNSESLSLYTVWNSNETSIDDFTAVPINIESQIDYLYGTPATGINKYNPDAEISLLHCLTAINFDLAMSNYNGEGNITKFAVKSESLGTSAKLNAMTGEIYDINGLNEEIIIRENFNTSQVTRLSEHLLIHSGESNIITIIIEMDGKIFEAKTEEMILQPGIITKFTVKITSQQMGSITVNDETMAWTNNVYDETLTAK